MRGTLVLFAASFAALAETPTAVYTLSDHHTYRWTNERDPLVKIAGVCRITVGVPTFTLACTGPPVGQPRSGQRHFYSIVLFRDLEENLYMAACAAITRQSLCDELRAGQTFSAEVEEQTIRIVIRDEQLPLRILEFRPKPTSIDSPTKGTPSSVPPSAGAPSAVAYSKVSESRGALSNVRPSLVSPASGAPSAASPSEVSTPVVSPTSARLHVRCSNGAARIYVDDQMIGNPPAEVPLVPGRHTVLVRAPGFAEWTYRVETPAGKVTRITAELER